MKMTNEAVRLLKKISHPRMIGTEGAEKARKEITEFYSSNGIPYEMETFECYGYDDGSAEIKIGEKSISARPVGNQNPFVVKGELLFIDNYRNIRNINYDIREKILLASGSLTVDDFRYMHDRNVAGYIIISPPAKDFITSTTRQILVRDKIIIPGLIVKHDDAIHLLKHTGKKIEISGNNKIKTVQGENIVVTVEGKKSKNPEILVFGHYDTVYRSPGATDNGGGTVIIAELVKKYFKNPPMRGIRFIHFSGEEFGLLGSKNYIRIHKDELANYKFTVNIDVAGDIFGLNMNRVIGGDDIFYMSKLIASNLGIVINTTKDIYSSDSMPFALEGIPSVNIARWGGKSSFNAHTINDKSNWTGKTGIEPLLIFSDEILNFTSNSALFPLERKVPEELMQKVKDYFKKSGYLGKEKMIDK